MRFGLKRFLALVQLLRRVNPTLEFIRPACEMGGRVEMRIQGADSAWHVHMEVHLFGETEEVAQADLRELRVFVDSNDLDRKMGILGCGDGGAVDFWLDEEDGKLHVVGGFHGGTSIGIGDPPGPGREGLATRRGEETQWVAVVLDRRQRQTLEKQVRYLVDGNGLVRLRWRPGEVKLVTPSTESVVEGCVVELEDELPEEIQLEFSADWLSRLIALKVDMKGAVVLCSPIRDLDGGVAGHYMGIEYPAEDFNCSFMLTAGPNVSRPVMAPRRREGKAERKAREQAAGRRMIGD